MKVSLLTFLCLLTINTYCQQDLIACNAYISQKAMAPGQYIIEKFKNHSVVFLAERHMIHENLEMVQNLIPDLYKNGIYNLGMEFGASEDQSRLDSLVNADMYDEKTAAKIMFNYNTAWANQEYIDVYKAAWKLNKSLPKGAPKFRIFNLSYRYNWEGFSGIRTPEKMKKVFYKGTADKYRADRIEKEILKKNQKILCLVGLPHAYTRYASSSFMYNQDNFCAFDRHWLGNRLYAKYPQKVYSIFLHQGLYNLPDHQPFLLQPANGAIEKIMLQNKNKPIGFDLVKTPLGKLRDDSINSMCYDNFTLDQFFDGYIFLKPLRELHGCTVIEDFVNETNIKEALAKFPDPDWHGKIETLADLLHFIRQNSNSVVEEYKNL